MKVHAQINQNITIGDDQPLAVIAGPCVVEDEAMILRTAETLQSITTQLKIPFIFKASYKKANRTSLDSFTTIGIEKALKILQKVRTRLGVSILTDIHTVEEAPLAADVSDIIQIPAFLCRQTDLLLAAAQTGKAVNIKKGQFMAPEDMAAAAHKVTSQGNPNVLLTERGTTFGYRNLVVDMRGLALMAECGHPVVFDATHSTQLPAGAGQVSGGQPQFALPLARAALATGSCHAIFIETHPDPQKALSDAKTQLPLSKMELILRQLSTIYQAVQALDTESDAA